jgi:Fanconi anemia group J protein
LSEGIDFSDKLARGVLAVGIPFPSLGDSKVKSKRDYNNRYSAEKGLLNGNEWYEIQAFRALNQAIGRW